MKKSILVVDLTFYPSSDANTTCALRLLQDQSNFAITVVSEKAHDAEEDFEEHEGLSIYRIMVHSFRKDLKSVTSLKDCISFVVHSLNYINAKIKTKRNYNDINFDRINNYLREIEKVVEINKYDIIISFAHPIESHYCASKLSSKYNKPWIAYYFDPYHSNVNKSVKGLRQRINLEKRMCLHADRVIVPRFFKNEMLKSGIVKSDENLEQLELPGIRKIEGNHDGDNVLLKGDKIKCVFVGNLYWKIRNPIKVMCAFEKLEQIDLYFVGGCFDGNMVEILKQEQICIPQNVFFVGKVTPEKAVEYLNEADILVNIGNAVNNQLPSKIFDYISMGKPIINVYKIRDCPSLKYFQTYPLAISLYEEDLNKSECLDKLQRFCDSGKGRRLQYSEIKRLYEETTVEYVKKRFAEQIETVLKSIEDQ